MFQIPLRRGRRGSINYIGRILTHCEPTNTRDTPAVPHTGHGARPATATWLAYLISLFRQIISAIFAMPAPIMVMETVFCIFPNQSCRTFRLQGRRVEIELIILAVRGPYHRSAKGDSLFDRESESI